VLDQFKGDAKERADSFVESINDAFVDRLPDLTWIDETTKKRAVEKVCFIRLASFTSCLSDILTEKI
jgi:endothelin-converting enzyme